MIRIENLHKRFGKLQVLDGVTFEIEEEGVVAVLGPNGSGKTTILKTILGMVLPQDGEIYFDNQPVLNNWDYRNRIGYMPQIARFPDNLTVRELIAMIKNIRDVTADEDALIERFELQASMGKKLGQLSGGTKQKVNIVLTFMFDSPLLILDEPTAGLDPVSLIRLKELIQEEKAKGKTFLITTHIMSLVEELSDQIVFLLEGQIFFQGSVEALKAQTGQKNLEHSIAKILETDA
ncbi:copper ABC transporter ATP-binding protein [Roseivirga sp. 4D4]|uniref:ABC transporter ATP-binding protein n=1 Tax=Roseivirga sp. 4D4 TaxID=1889784 RepID=UPI0008536ADF|nr:ABC transporter ATP-binding protein [Roseivirga sp. 4D4]OEK02323.1 copper ABC transporter ATP-binding protein [Roseivirga sp. 4D4]